MRLIAMALVVISAVGGAVPVAAAEESLDPTLSSSRQPVGHSSQHSGVDIGHMRIPTIGLDEVVRAGVALSVIDRGVAHWSGTSLAGGDGNVVLAGHRTTHTAPFRDLDRLEPGDIIFLTMNGNFEVMYRVTETFIVSPDDIWITYETGDAIITLFACHPKGSARQRIVVRGELIGSGKIA